MEPSSGHFPSLSMYTEIIVAGSSKQPIIDTGDDESFASANKVESTDDLLIEILLRLPVISLRLFKYVSKRWLSLIADPNFIMIRSRNPKIYPPYGFFLQPPSASSEFAYILLDARIPGAQSPLITTFTFDINSDYIEVLQACNGLMLCCIRPDKFYVYNPTTNKYKMLPLPNVWEPNRIISDMAIAFDPKPNTTNSRATKPDKGHAPDISKTHVSIFKAATVVPPRTNTDRGRILATADAITRGPLPDKGPTPATNSRKRNTRKP
ncbi:F-box protein-like protein [Tanacetum coccineum]